jgi:regulator of protease activity HflC (stomatin/prohibitin superfamily)
MPSAVVVVLIAVAALVIASMIGRLFTRVTVLEFERGLRYVRGRFTGVLSPGQYYIWASTTSVRKVDVRPKVTAVSGQEVLSSDGVALKVSIVARYRVADPALAVNGVENYEAALYTALQLALRTVVSATPVEALLANRGALGKQITELSITAAAAAGLELLDADLKDLTLPGELKKIFAQVVRARQEGLAALEKARGETAALRNLANAAQMIERNPGLMQLRVLQVLGQQSGNTVVLGLPSSTTFIETKGKRELGGSSTSPSFDEEPS